MANLALRYRFWPEAGLALTSAVSSVLTLVWRDWIEIVFRADPDAHSGAMEVAIALALAVAAIVAGALARAEWRRLQPSGA